MKKMLNFLLVISFIAPQFLVGQSITLYGLKSAGNPMNPSSLSMNMVQIDPFTGNIDTLFHVDSSFAVAAGSSTFDHQNGQFIYWGPDNQNDYRLFSIDIPNQVTQLSPTTTTERAIELEFDLETGITYGMLYNDVTNVASFGSVDAQTGTTQNIVTITDLEGVAIGSSTFDSNNKRYFFFGVDNNYNKILYTIDILNAQVESSPVINDNDIETVAFFEYSNINDKLYGIYSQVDTSQVDSFTFTNYREMFVAEIDAATGVATPLGTTPIFSGFTVGTQVGGVAYDQASSSYIMRGVDDTGMYLKVISTVDGSVISSLASNDNFGEIQVDNLNFAVSFYVVPVEEQLTLEGIRLLPNPVDKSIFIELENEEVEILDVRIYDIQGRLLSQEKILPSGDRIPLDVSNLLSGNYIVSIIDDKGKVFRQKITKL